ncbi:hypothetical protein E4T56_gene178 [Termitomyces sp. T112]|nr:hypothetical protein E4T56_gene178 [Termitomyces sp. T112]
MGARILTMLKPHASSQPNTISIPNSAISASRVLSLFKIQVPTAISQANPSFLQPIYAELRVMDYLRMIIPRPHSNHIQYLWCHETRDDVYVFWMDIIVARHRVQACQDYSSTAL